MAYSLNDTGLVSDVQNEKVVWVPARRLNYDSGDIAYALDPSAPSLGYCKSPVIINGGLYVVTGAMGCAVDPGYMAAWAHMLISISDFGGPAWTYGQKLKAQSHRHLMDYTGIVVECSVGEFVFGGKVEIVPEQSRLG
jgi:hypothetical protein